MTFTAQTRPNVSALVCPLPIRVDEHGNVRPIHALSAEDAALIAGFESVRRWWFASAGATTTWPWSFRSVRGFTDRSVPRPKIRMLTQGPCGPRPEPL